MSTHSNFIEQRLNFAKDLLRSGNINRAISICEDLLSPAAMISHGKEIFTFIADAVEKSGNIDKAEAIRIRSKELFADSSIIELEVSSTSADFAHAYVLNLFPQLMFPPDADSEIVMYDDISYSFDTIPAFDYTVVSKPLPRSEDSIRSLSALEELAKRLEHAKIPVIDEEKTIASPSFMPSIVTETMADIYEQQGAYAQAIKAYQVLARNNPDKLEYFESKISQLRLRQ